MNETELWKARAEVLESIAVAAFALVQGRFQLTQRGYTLVDSEQFRKLADAVEACKQAALAEDAALRKVASGQQVQPNQMTLFGPLDPDGASAPPGVAS